MASYRHAVEEKKAAAIRVIIAEDEPMVALSLSDLLEDEGYEVTLARDGAQALIEARRMGSTLDALLTDLNMPNMGGEDLIRALRILLPDLPIVVVTGSPPLGGLDELRHQGGGTEPFALVTKPMNYADLVDTLRSAILSKHPEVLAKV